MSTEYEKLAATVGPRDNLTKKKMLDLFAAACLNPSILPQFREGGVETYAMWNLNQAFKSLAGGQTRIQDYTVPQALLLRFVFRQKRLNGEIDLGEDSPSEFLVPLRETLATQEHGFDFYLSGGLFNG